MSTFTKLMVLLVALALIPFHLNPDAFLADDAYFYLQLADNIRLGHGSTFHQITPTNGYHPLWLLCCVVGAFISGGSKTVFLQLMGFVQDGLFLGSLVLLWKCAQKLNLETAVQDDKVMQGFESESIVIGGDHSQMVKAPPIRNDYGSKNCVNLSSSTAVSRLNLMFYSLGVLSLALVMVIAGGLRLFESHLSLTLQLAILLLFLRITTQSAKKLVSLKTMALTGVVMGLCMLSRLDTVFFCGVVWCFLVPVIWKQSKKWTSLLALTVPPCILLIPYLSWNYVMFGHLVPISGVIKSIMPQVDLSYARLGLHGGPAVIAAVCLLICSLVVEKSRINRLFFSILLCSVSLYALYIAMFSIGSQWHYTTVYIAITFGLMRVATAVWQSLKNSAFLGNTANLFRTVCHSLTLAAFVCLIGVSFLKTQYHFSMALVLAGKESLTQESAKMPAAKQIAAKLKQTLPQGTAIFMFDYPGMVAYYSGMKIVPFDGLMNDFAYNDLIAEMGISAYAEKNDIHYVIAPIAIPQRTYDRLSLIIKQGPNQATDIHVFTPIGDRAAGSFSLPPEQIVFRMPNPVSPIANEFPEVALWSL
ncbi:MAG: hypothetical protein WCF65_06545 [Parachlamydiaceae bacterium]